VEERWELLRREFLGAGRGREMGEFLRGTVVGKLLWEGSSLEWVVLALF
jgi:hypothetical protein